jgi:type I restriction enzyme S subunit
MNCTHHVNQASINTTFLSKNVEVPLPPLPEQEHIVAKIEETFTQLEAGIAELGNAKAQLKRYRAAVFKSAVEGELTREWREAHDGEIEPAEKLLARILTARREKWEAESGKGKYKEPAAPNTDGLPELPKGWIWVSLSAITSLIADVDHKMPKARDGGVPYVSTKDFYGENDIDFENAKKISEIDYNKLCRKIKPGFGDILLSRYGTVGEVRIVKTKRDFQASYSIAILKMLLPDELTEFAALALKSEPLKTQIRKYTRATAQPDLGLGHIREFVMPFPPLEEQKAIVAKVERRLSVADEIEKELDGALVRAERLRGSVLKSAFEGRLV